MTATRAQRRWRTATAASQPTVSQTAVAANAGSTDPSLPSSPLSSMRLSMANPAPSTRRRSSPTAKWIGWLRRGSSRCLSSSYASRAVWAAANFSRVVVAEQTASARQWLASASMLAASGWLVSSSPMILAGVGRSIWQHNPVPSRACRSC